MRLNSNRGISTLFFYAGLLVIFAITGGIILVLLSSAYSIPNTDEGIGFRQAAVLEAYQEMDNIMLYTRVVAKAAASEAMNALIDNGIQAAWASQSDCGSIGSYPAWNNATNDCFPKVSNTEVSPAFASQLTSALNRRWDNPILKRPVSYTFSLYQGDTLIGLANEEVVLPILGIKGKSAEEARQVFAADNTGTLVWPTKATRLPSCYGAREGDSTIHDGIDIAEPNSAAEGDPVYAIASGVVQSVCQEWVNECACSLIDPANKCSPSANCKGKCGNYGNTLIIMHDNGLYSRYSHLKSITVKEGDPVETGEQIAELGDTGISAKAHLDLKIFTSYDDAISKDKGKNPLCFYDDGILSRLDLEGGSNCDKYTADGETLSHTNPTLASECEGIAIPMVAGHTIGNYGPLTDPENAEGLVAETEKNINAQFKAIVEDAAEKYGLQPAYLMGIITQESQGLDLISPTGARGPLQITGTTARNAMGHPETKSCCTAEQAQQFICHQITPSCPPDDWRGDPAQAIPAAAKYIAEDIMPRYDDYSEQIMFGTVAYNSGGGSNAGEPGLDAGIEKCKKEESTDDPSWNCVKKYVRGEGRNYGDAVARYTEAWGGSFYGKIKYSSVATVNKDIGSLRFKPSFAVPIKDMTSEIKRMVNWASHTAAAQNDRLNREIDTNVNKWAITVGFCFESPKEQYLNQILLGLQECRINKQQGCACDLLPEPSMLENDKYTLTVRSNTLELSGGDGADAVALVPFEIGMGHKPGDNEAQGYIFNFTVKDKKIMAQESFIFFIPPSADTKKVFPLSENPIGFYKEEKEEIWGIRENAPIDPQAVFQEPPIEQCLLTKQLIPICAVSEEQLMGPNDTLVNPNLHTLVNPTLHFGIQLKDTKPPEAPSVSTVVGIDGVTIIYTKGEEEEISGYIIYCDGKLIERIPYEEATGSYLLQSCGDSLFIPGFTHTLEVGAFDYGGNEERKSTTYTPGTGVLLP